jgi:hypothetical protein
LKTIKYLNQTSVLKFSRMKNRIILFTLGIVLGFSSLARADEGMWLPLLLNRINYTDMQLKGLKLSKDQLYSLNQACLKDAIISLDHGSCTGEMISGEGLLLTNHHCGYEAIQTQSSVNHDYLTDGFWAMKADEELPNPGKTVSFLLRMEDVSDRVLADVKAGMSEADRKDKIEAAIAAIQKDAVGSTYYEATVESMFEGNEYYLFVYETFTDVRLVGAPPSAIGKFGGDTDNWMWPRQTGDFCLLRVYTGADGKPAVYAKDNVPYKPKYVLPISLKGVKEGDFAMIWGYPGATDRYVTSFGIKMKLDQLNPADIKLKRKKMDIQKAAMDADAKIRIQYASKYAYLGNFWKKSLEESKALRKLKVYEDRKASEDAFAKWADQDEARRTKYGRVLPDLAEVFAARSADSSELSTSYFFETISGPEILMLAYKSNELADVPGKGAALDSAVAAFSQEADAVYKDFDQATDKKIMAAMFAMYRDDVADIYHPGFFRTVQKKFKGDFVKYVDHLYKKSIFATADKMKAFLANPDTKKLKKDPIMRTTSDLIGAYMRMRMTESLTEEKYAAAKRLLIAGLQEMDPALKFYPDANSTMRVTFGSVQGYAPADAVEYAMQTTLKGVMEKEDPANEEFIVPAKLKVLYQNKDYGQYGENGIMPVCFLTNNDITGGNSGSPVINGNGELIGAAFDGNSESMSSDIKFNPTLQRTIVCDIRYILFVIDKYAGAGYLIKELKLVRN